MPWTPKSLTSPDQRRAVAKSIEQRQLRKATEHLLGLCDGLTADGDISAQEVKFLRTWLADYPEVAAVWPGSQIASRVKTIMADGVVTAEERQDLLETLRQLAGDNFLDTGSAGAGPTVPVDTDPEITFHNMLFCFTGRFVFGTRAACERAVLALGAVPTDNISKKLDILVIGAMIEPSWAHTTFGRKIEKAMAIRQDGAQLIIASERHWILALEREANR